MTERPYTIAEIDALRSACRTRAVWGTTCPRAPPGQTTMMSGGYDEKEMTARVEAHVRTYMHAGKTAEDLYAEDDPAYRARKAARQAAINGPEMRLMEAD